MTIAKALQQSEINGHKMVFLKEEGNIKLYRCTECEAMILVDWLAGKYYITGSALERKCFDYKMLFQFIAKYEYKETSNARRNKRKKRVNKRACYKDVLSQYNKKGIHLTEEHRSIIRDHLNISDVVLTKDLHCDTILM